MAAAACVFSHCWGHVPYLVAEAHGGSCAVRWRSSRGQNPGWTSTSQPHSALEHIAVAVCCKQRFIHAYNIASNIPCASLPAPASPHSCLFQLKEPLVYRPTMPLTHIFCTTYTPPAVPSLPPPVLIPSLFSLKVMLFASLLPTPLTHT